MEIWRDIASNVPRPLSKHDSYLVCSRRAKAEDGQRVALLRTGGFLRLVDSGDLGGAECVRIFVIVGGGGKNLFGHML